MSDLSEMTVSSVLVANMKPQLMLLPVTVKSEEQIVNAQALLDCGASREFMYYLFVEIHNILLIKLRKLRTTRNVDRTLNEKGLVMHKAIINLNVNRRTDPMAFYVTELRKDVLILGLT
jgi:hypothetical protein